jgi:aryl-alcohol dehydrogenase-like predicted oxidoreductase
VVHGVQLAAFMTSKAKSHGGTPTLGEMPMRQLGKTGEQVSILGLGGSHIGKPDLRSSEAVRIIRAALDGGMNFMDNSWDYNGGASETRLGKALKDGYRRKAFVMTKVDGRTAKEAARQLDQSLKRLGTDHIDLLQHHEVIRFDDPDRIFAPGGAMEAFIAARDAGKIRYIGFTGHKDPHIHLYMLEKARAKGFRFDTVQMPLNVMDAHFRSFKSHVLPVLVREGIGVLGMKSMGSGVLLKSKIVTPIECLHYALNLPTSVVITGIDSQEILEQAFEAARTFRPLTPQELKALLARTAAAASGGEYELFKTTAHFDSTIENPAWLGGQPARVKILTA